ncbi:MAG TPA: efflux RND transporter periplasmic adaptor subunit [Verrucomicrobiae bacterium]|jgi:membrane fusion protein (multidrug efflux system)|nr:efflux RND transporter periplasmic adaptor subunit [Verrucomicrobiae bacterium]
MGKATAYWSITATMLAAILLSGGCKKKAPPPAPPPKVEVISVTPRDIPIYREWIGTSEGYVTAQIRPQVSGYLMTQNYVEGSAVKKGDTLFQIDPRPFEATLAQYNAKLAQDQAQLVKTEMDVKRFTPLAKDGAVSQEEVDDAIQANLAAAAAVKADQAAIENGQLNVGFTKITSPIDGVAGLALAQIGDLVSPGGTVLTTVSTLDPLRVYFSVSEQFYLDHRRQFATPEERTRHQANLEFQLILADGSVYAHPGKFFFENRQVDVGTGTIQLAALFPNPEGLLRPGGYARIRSKSDVMTNALALPQRAVTELQSAYQVAVVGVSNKIHIQSVKVGEQVGAEWIIEEGLHPNDRVVAEGTQKAREGMVVDPQPFDQKAVAGGPWQTNQTSGQTPPAAGQ